MEFDLTASIAILERTPATLRSLLSGLPSQWIGANEGPETFSPYDVLGHLIHGERTDWLARAKIIIDQGEDRRFAPYERFAHFEESKGKTLNELLDEFAGCRAKNLRTLKGWHLTEAQLSLEGVHPRFGVVTLRQLLATWTAHDLSHLAQIARVLAKQYRDAVGPWREYLPIMER